MSSRDRFQFSALTDAELDLLLEFIARQGTSIVSRSRGPVPLWRFSQELMQQTRFRSPVSFTHFCEALRTLLSRMDHPRLRLLCPGTMPGAGYVYDAANPDTWPFRSSLAL